MAIDITSPGNERIKWLVRLRERRHRDTEGVFLVEGERLYSRALQAGLDPEVTFVEEGSDIETAGETLTVSSEALNRASYRQTSQGVIGVFAQMETGLDRLKPGGDPLILVTEDVEKPGNLGAMLRTARVVGTDAVVTVGGSVDVHNPNVVRASTGALFSVPIAVSGWNEVGPWIADKGLKLICSSPDATPLMWDTNLTGAIAVAVGSEERGLSEEAISLADSTIQIPQAEDAMVDSLNVSVSAAILLFEARRQRH